MACVNPGRCVSRGHHYGVRGYAGLVHYLHVCGGPWCPMESERNVIDPAVVTCLWCRGGVGQGP